ncbi:MULTISPECIES: hypothetical protein [unclassified Vibrio]|uniref:hypothetical protein n=1 Tax=unclassified Vibrio TaxID=2614977 RepID=UPI0010572E33|nr:MULTISPECIES: hypothetical protein [unclassified Vibrio]TKF38445.1 hypothetical protein FCV57_15145 [Vibrio sp. F13]
MLVTQFYKSEMAPLINLFLSLQMIGIVFAIEGRLDKQFILKISLMYCWLCIILLGADSVYRILNPISPSLETLAAFESRGTTFYIYKFNTLMFGSSNTTALAALGAFFLLLFISDTNEKKQYLPLILLLVIIYFTFSRAAILAVLVGLLLLYDLKLSKLIVSLLLFFGWNILFYIKNYSDDLSLLTKVQILERIYDFYSNQATLEHIFTGVGLNESPKYIQINAHNVFMTYIFELGLIGLIALLFWIGNLMYKSKQWCAYVIIPILFSGLSYFIYAGSPFIFAPMVLVCLLANKRERFIGRRKLFL